MKANNHPRAKPSKSSPRSGHASHQPQNVGATDAIPPLHHCAGPLHRRRTGKIARLPRDTRDFLNNLLRDGAPYSVAFSTLSANSLRPASNATTTALLSRPKEPQKLPQMPAPNAPDSSCIFCSQLHLFAAACSLLHF
jgi:hypothetical protein